MSERTVLVTGSVAVDYLMTFPGSFTEQLIADQLAHVSLSFLVDALDVRPGGVGANISYGLALLGLRPALVAAVGADFAPYAERLRSAGVDLSHLRTSGTRHTARFLCTTDRDGNQLASFYPGAMDEAVELDLTGMVHQLDGAALVHIGADQPEAMLRHTDAARALGLPFAADPSQQLARLDRDAARRLVDGARFLFTNAYERALLLSRTGWTEDEVLARTGAWITTLAEKGSRVDRAGEPPVEVAAVPARTAVDPTGAGDAYRAGFLTAVVCGLDPRNAAQIGSALATCALESVGPQTYGSSVDWDTLTAVLTAAYGPEAAAVARSLPGVR
ncbi:carbohydrate kinase family protein [Streptomyces sp. NPDC054794]